MLVKQNILCIVICYMLVCSMAYPPRPYSKDDNVKVF